MKLRVRDYGPGPAEDMMAGHGIVGMRDRATIAGGTFEFGAAEAADSWSTSRCRPTARARDPDARRGRPSGRAGGFAALLGTQADMDVVASAADGAEAVRLSAEHSTGCRPDGRAHAGARRHRGHATDRRRGRGRPAHPHPHDVRPRRLRLRRAAGGRERIPPQGRPGRDAVRSRARHRRRRGAARPHDHAPADRRVRTAASSAGRPEALSALTPRETEILGLVAEGSPTTRSPVGWC